MSVDHYAGSARRWAEGATLVYGPIAHELVETSPHHLNGRVVLDAGAGTGVASTALVARGARPVAVDLSYDMLAWNAPTRPPGMVADIVRLAMGDEAVDDSVAAFVFNHLPEPESGMAEVIRVTRSGGALLACVYANASRSEVRDAVDEAARREGWQVPSWYVEIKRRATPILGTAPDMARAAKAAGLIDIAVDERAVETGVTAPEQLVAYRLGQAHFSAWLDRIGPNRANEIKGRVVEAIRPIMRPYRPIVVFLSAVVPGPGARGASARPGGLQRSSRFAG